MVKTIETLRVPDFTGPDGIEYTDIEISVASENHDSVAPMAETTKALLLIFGEARIQNQKNQK